MRSPLALVALSLSLALSAWLVVGQRSRAAPAPVTGALVPHGEPRGAGPAARPAELLAPAELATIEVPRRRIEASAIDVAQDGPVSMETQLQMLDQAIEEASVELASLQIQEMATELRAAGRIADGARSQGADDPALIVIHHWQDTSRHVLIPPAGRPDRYAGRARPHRLEELSGLDIDRRSSVKRLQLTTLLDARARVAASAR